jgi:2-hydroxychromene-2-carboxylate isomerase
MSALTILFDFKSPHAYLALAPTLAMLDELSVTADWQPLLVAPQQRPEQPDQADDRGAAHRWHRACYRLMDLRRYAAVQKFGEGCFSDARLFDCGPGRVAAAGYLWGQQRFPQSQSGLLTGLFERFWQGELDINSIAQVDQAITELTKADTGFADNAQLALTQLDVQQSTLQEAGMFDVPGYLVDDNLYYGRQHLPVVRWLLQGAQGHPPAWGKYDS